LELRAKVKKQGTHETRIPKTGRAQLRTIVITGSTRGIGYGLADAFLDLGCDVVISGRTSTSVDNAVTKLSTNRGVDHIIGQACDVSQIEQIQALWDTAKAHFGHIDVWINNAGINHPRRVFWEHPPEQIQAVVDTNLVGAMYGSQIALRGLLDQGYGSLYNMEGLGSDGRRVEGMTLYSTTKYGLRYLTDSLVEETKGTSVLVGALSPGMVLTDMLTGEEIRSVEDWEATKRIYNILADRVEDVAPWLARQVLDNDKTGVRIKWLTQSKIIARFVTAPFHKRDLFGESED
jgi:NAD(P)-dependent dehydrogenase (short-subunit alcohol dehydrogenase family)